MSRDLPDPAAPQPFVSELLGHPNRPAGPNSLPGALNIPIDAFAVTVHDGPDGTPLVRKDHSGPLPHAGRTEQEHAAAVGREAAWLAAAAGLAGVAPLVTNPAAETDTNEPAASVTTAFIGGATLRSSRLDPAAAARALACVADTIAALAERDLAHGAIAPEHILIGANGAGVLCSPNTATDPADHQDDLAGLGACVTFCLERWAGTQAMPDYFAAWLLLARRLEEGDPAMGPWRASTTLRELGEAADPINRAGRWKQLLSLPRRAGTVVAFPARSLLGVAAIGVLAASGLALLKSPPMGAEISGPELMVGNTLIRVGRKGQTAVALQPPEGCPGAEVYLLDPTNAWVWRFDSITADGHGIPTFQIPGATGLDIQIGRDGCPILLAVGPAGSVEVGVSP